MRWKRTISMIDVHAEGDVGKVITGGVIDVPGATMLEKMNHINEVDDTIRRLTVFEPRGACATSVNLLLPPTHPEADAGFIILQADRAHAMSGSNCICVVTALLETGILKMRDPETEVTLDTPAGLVRATALCRDGKVESVSLLNVPSYADQLDVTLEVEGLGRIVIDLAYGGVFYALVDVEQVGLKIEPAAARELVSWGMKIKRAARDQVRVRHPELAALDQVSYVMFRDRRGDDSRVVRTCTCAVPGRADRSPCGTGSSAQLAVMHARGEIAVGDRLTTRSIIDSAYEMACVAETEVAGRPAIIARITGRGWIFGFHQLGLDPSDPYPLGYVLSDTWGEGVDEIL